MAIVFLKDQRVILIEAPTTEVTCQELLTAIRDYEDSIPGMDIYKIADASGKEDLGGGLFVGITLKLINWTLKFEDRAGPSTIICDVGQGNLLGVSGSVENDDLVFVNPIEPSTYVLVTKTSAVSAALLNAVTLPAETAEAVWNEPLAPYTGSGTAGRTLAELSQSIYNISSSLTVQAIVDGVWNAQQTDYTLSGSFGELLSVVSQSVIQTSESVNQIYQEVIYISSSVNENGVTLQQVSESVNLIYDQTSYITSSVTDISQSVNLIYDQTTDISQSIIILSDQITDISQSVNNIQVDTGSIANAVWSELLVDYTASLGTMGYAQGLSNVDTGSIAYAVWSQSLTPFTGSTDTAGGVLYDVSQNLSVSGSSPDVIADAVWDELLAGHQTSGSAGAELGKMPIVIGLLQSNFKMYDQTYDANGNMTLARVRIYPTPADEAADTNHLKQYKITATYDGDGNLTDYNSVEE